MDAVRGRGESHVHRGFGLEFACSFALPLPRVADGTPQLMVEAGPAEELDRAWSGPLPEPAVIVQQFPDGCLYRVERGVDGDHRFAYGEHARFHLSADLTRLMCSAADGPTAAWQRVLLDSVLATVALLHGREALHASAVVTPAGVVAFIGPTGGGKTSLAAQLVLEGFALMADDVVALSRHGAQVFAHPAPAVMNLSLGLSDGPEPEQLGRRLAVLGDEAWLAVEKAAVAPASMAAVCLIERRPGAAADVRRLSISPVELLRHSLTSGRNPDRLRRRFELVSDLAAQCEIFALTAGTDLPPAEVAAVARAHVPALAPTAVGAGR